MRMRLKTNVFERLDNCGKRFIQTSDDDKNVSDVLLDKEYLNFSDIYGNDNKIILEIGCGQGKFACETAKARKDINVLAVERVSNVILTGAENANKEGIENICFLRCKAECLPKYVPSHSVSELYLNFSTPLPKKGYVKQRLTNPRFLKIYSELLTPKGFIFQKTDDRDFFDYSLTEIENNGFDIVFQTENLHKDGECGIITEYERKFITLGKPIYALKAVKRN